MLRPKKTIDAEGTAARLDELGVAIQREAEGAEADPFDDAILGAVFGVIELSKTHAKGLADLEARMAKLARRT